MNSVLANIVYPSPILIFGFMLMILFDLISGIQKANKFSKATTSKGMRRTVFKMKNYTTLMGAVLVILNIASVAKESGSFAPAFSMSIDGLFYGCIYIEFKSVIENLIVINTNYDLETPKPNELCNRILLPLHNILILKFK